MTWTDDRVEMLKKLWTEGLSASQIAARLGGVTRNAVIGKVHRLGLSGRAVTVRIKTSRPKRRPAMQPARAPGDQGVVYMTRGNVALQPAFEPFAEHAAEPRLGLIEELVIPVGERASILTLKESMCHWPIGDPSDDQFHFCGRKSAPNMPYCEHHARVAYQPAQSRRRDRRLLAI